MPMGLDNKPLPAAASQPRTSGSCQWTLDNEVRMTSFLADKHLIWPGSFVNQHIVCR